MKRVWIFFLVPFLFINCKNKKQSLKDDDVVDITEFIEFFPEAKLPVRVGDTTLTRKTTDSALIGYKIFTQFIPDSVLTKEFGKTARPKLYPIARTQEKGKEIYLFIKAVNGTKRVGFLACFTKDEKYLNAMALVRNSTDKTASAYGLLDNKFQLTTYRERKTGADLHFKRNVYFYNSAANEFTLIMTEPNEEIIEQIINPIDTFARAGKFSGDYVKDKRNYISVRDTKKTNEFQFFIHFEKDKATCTGELKGIGKMIDKNTGLYQAPGNPCAIEFKFSAAAVSLKETGGCGSYRNIKCFFEGSYPRKAVPKPKAASKKK
ncbi:MAG: hypothetical protein H7Y31_07280 [Chitinophagaceae bacterium]|nr:hypothetical protein [Chitinophagaceae bacterium]